MKNKLKKAINALGCHARDPFTGIEGTIITFKGHATGCIQVGIMPPSINGEVKKAWYVDIHAVEIGEPKVKNWFLERILKEAGKMFTEYLKDTTTDEDLTPKKDGLITPEISEKLNKIASEFSDKRPKTNMV